MLEGGPSDRLGPVKVQQKKLVARSRLLGGRPSNSTSDRGQRLNVLLQAIPTLLERGFVCACPTR
jgi:hypothetical protein